METTDRSEGRDELARYVPAVGAAVVLVVAVPLGILRGAPTVVLWIAFALLASAVIVFWEALRTVLDPSAPADASPVEALALEDRELRAKKKSAMRALKELEFEHSIRRITDDDYERLREQYRADARAAMEALDRGLGAYLEKAEAAATALLETKSEESLMKSEEVSSASRDGERESETVEATAEKPAGGDEAPTARQSERVCAKCETQNDADAAFCKRCGTKLEAA